jgi:hypothetical protein
MLSIMVRLLKIFKVTEMNPRLTAKKDANMNAAKK